MDLIDLRPFMWGSTYEPLQTAKPMIDSHAYNSCEGYGIERFRQLKEMPVTMLEIEGFKNGLSDLEGR